MPLTLLVAATGERLVGFIEVSLRSYIDGCDPRRPIEMTPKRASTPGLATIATTPATTVRWPRGQ